VRKRNVFTGVPDPKSSIPGELEGTQSHRYRKREILRIKMFSAPWPK
jgi:hypothetical protein